MRSEGRSLQKDLALAVARAVYQELTGRIYLDVRVSLDSDDCPQTCVRFESGELIRVNFNSPSSYSDRYYRQLQVINAKIHYRLHGVGEVREVTWGPDRLAELKQKYNLLVAITDNPEAYEATLHVYVSQIFGYTHCTTDPVREWEFHHNGAWRFHESDLVGKINFFPLKPGAKAAATAEAAELIEADRNRQPGRKYPAERIPNPDREQETVPGSWPRQLLLKLAKKFVSKRLQPQERKPSCSRPGLCE